MFISIICLLWALFQLAIASFLIIDAIFIRSIHLAFALIITYTSTSFFKKKKAQFSLIKGFITALVVFSALYFFINYQSIIQRHGSPSQLDIFFGIILILFLLEGARRHLGPALSLIVIVFCLYAFFRPYLPEFLSAKRITLSRFVTQVTLSSEGIYGIPLDVSARVVYLFVLLGTLLHTIGAGHFFTNLAMSLLGKYKGGPAKASIVASGLTGMFSGSSIANIVTTGNFTIPMMKKVGYPKEKAASIEVASSTDGQLAPPIMGAAAFIMAEYINLPYFEIVKAAAIPAFSSFLALFFITHFEACKLNLKTLNAKEILPFISIIKKGFYFLIPVFTLLHQLLFLRHSPEKSAFNTIVVTFLLIFTREVIFSIKAKKPFISAFKNSLKIIQFSFIEGSKNMVAIALATATAGIIVAVVAMGLGGFITEIITLLSLNNIFILLLITAVCSLLIGMGLPTTATYIVMASLTAPAIVSVSNQMGFEIPLIAAHLFCFYFGILADDTPPVGLAAYTAASIAKSDPIKTGLQAFSYDIRTAILPFMFVFNTNIILYQINDPLKIIGILLSTSVASISFVSAIQGWFLKKNHLYDNLFLLCLSFLAFRTDFVLTIIPSFPLNEFFIHLLPIFLLGLFFMYQKKIQKKTIKISF